LSAKTLLAKGLYIIPIIMAYHPLLLNGPIPEVIKTDIFSIFSIIVFVVCMERYFLTRLNWPETILQGASALLLIWANPTYNYIGMAMFCVLAAYQIIKMKKNPSTHPLPSKPSAS
jgi:TRAP-type uncharacterized transport system fused permease subunit